MKSNSKPLEFLNLRTKTYKILKSVLKKRSPALGSSESLYKLLEIRDIYSNLKSLGDLNEKYF